MKKLIPLTLIILLFVFSGNMTVSAANYTDVNDRYKNAVDYITELNYAQGISVTQFGTHSSIIRIDAAVIVARAMGFDENTKSPPSGFSDVPKNRAWAVDALVHRGIINGKLSGKYGSSDPMTRSEMAKVIASAYGLTANQQDIPFTDVNKNFKQFVAALVENGISSGKTATSFGASDNIKRGEFAIFIYNADGLSKIPPEVDNVS